MRFYVRKKFEIQNWINSCVKFNLMNFEGEIIHFFLKNETVRSERVNFLYKQVNAG